MRALAAAAGLLILAGCEPKSPEAPEVPDVAIPAADEGSAPTPPDGAALYAAYCALCHGTDGEGYTADNANAVANATFLATASDALIERAIARGRPGTTMSAWSVEFGGPMDVGEVAAVTAHIRAWQTEPSVDTSAVTVEGEAERALPQWEIRCASCHGEAGEGGEYASVANPELLAVADDGFLRYAIDQGRPGTPMPEYGTVLTPQTLDDLVVLVRSWQSEPGAPPAELPVLGDPVLNPGGSVPGFASTQGRYVSVADLFAAVEAASELVILDARPPADYVESHIAGAVSVPFYAVEEALDLLPKEPWTVCYCACPHAESNAAADALEAAGYPNVKVLDEGYFAWVEAGHPIVAGVTPL